MQKGNWGGNTTQPGQITWEVELALENQPKSVRFDVPEDYSGVHVAALLVTAWNNQNARGPLAVANGGSVHFSGQIASMRVNGEQLDSGGGAREALSGLFVYAE